MIPIGVRKIEISGRFQLTKEARNAIGITRGDDVEIFVDNDYIVIEKYQERCSICEDNTNVKPYREKFICEECIDGIKNL